MLPAQPLKQHPVRGNGARPVGYGAGPSLMRMLG
jgi:hypothetical protein